MRRILRLVGLTLALPLLYLVASLVLPLIPGPGPDLSGPPAYRIGLWQGAIHTDILLPLTPETRARFAFAEAAGVPLGHPDAEWLIFGWGSAAFYTTAGTYADITASAVLTAATGDAAVIRLDVVGSLQPFENLRFLTPMRSFRRFSTRRLLPSPARIRWTVPASPALTPSSRPTAISVRYEPATFG